MKSKRRVNAIEGHKKKLPPIDRTLVSNGQRRLESLPVEILEFIFTYAQNARLPYTSKVFYLISLKETIRVNWLTQRYGKPTTAALRGVHWRFFRSRLLVSLEILYRRKRPPSGNNPHSITELQSGSRKRCLQELVASGGPKRVRFNNRLYHEAESPPTPRTTPPSTPPPTAASVNYPQSNNRKNGDKSPALCLSTQSIVPDKTISFRRRDLPCWLLSASVAKGKENPDDPQRHPLSLIIALLSRGAHPDTMNGYPLIKSASLGRLNTVRCLLDAGAQVSPLANRPLLEATKARHLPVMKELLERGAVADAAALKAAVETAEWDAVDLLIGYGAKPDINVVNAL